MNNQEKKRANMEVIISLTKNWIATLDMQQQCNFTKTCIYTNGALLVEAGYLETRLVKGNSKFSPPVREYKRLIAKLPDDAFRPKAKKIPVEHVPSLADAIYRHDMDKHRESYSNQTRQARNEFKSPRVYVSAASV